MHARPTLVLYGTGKFCHAIRRNPSSMGRLVLRALRREAFAEVVGVNEFCTSAVRESLLSHACARAPGQRD